VVIGPCAEVLPDHRWVPTHGVPSSPTGTDDFPSTLTTYPPDVPATEAVHGDDRHPRPRSARGSATNGDRGLVAAVVLVACNSSGSVHDSLAAPTVQPRQAVELGTTMLSTPGRAKAPTAGPTTKLAAIPPLPAGQPRVDRQAHA
jgi:hypothetical protein